VKGQQSTTSVVVSEEVDSSASRGGEMHRYDERFESLCFAENAFLFCQLFIFMAPIMYVIISLHSIRSFTLGQ